LPWPGPTQLLRNALLNTVKPKLLFCSGVFHSLGLLVSRHLEGTRDDGNKN
jgi:hypothetical protein